MASYLSQFEPDKKYRFSDEKYDAYYRSTNHDNTRDARDIKDVTVCDWWYGMTNDGRIVRPQWCEEVPE